MLSHPLCGFSGCAYVLVFRAVYQFYGYFLYVHNSKFRNFLVVGGGGGGGVVAVMRIMYHGYVNDKSSCWGLPIFFFFSFS